MCVGSWILDLGSFVLAYVHTYMHTYMHLGSWIFCSGYYLYSSTGSFVLDLGYWILDLLCWHMCLHTCIHTCTLDLGSFVLDRICILPLDLRMFRLSVAILVLIK